MYCVISKGELEDSYLLFQVLQLQDWGGEKPIPLYTTIVGNLSWLLIPDKGKAELSGDGKDSKDREAKLPEVQIDLSVKDILLV
jgi:hypothetical protein